MPRPERRTKADLAAVALILSATLVGSLTIWWFSDARAAELDIAQRPIADAPPPTSVPASLHEVWRAPSPVTPEPVVAGPAAVTAVGGKVLGRDPATGDVRWSYSREIPLCTVGAEWGRAIAVFRKSSNCSEVTSLDGSTGKRGPQRNSNVPSGTRLLSDGTYVTATGSELFATWRSDLVRTMQYGIPTAIKIPQNNLERPECSYASIAVGDRRVAVVEECPAAAADRITVLKAHPEDNEQPEQVFTTLLGGSHARAVAVNGERVAVVLRDRSELVVYDFDGNAVVARSPVRTGPIPQPDANVRVPSSTSSRSSRSSTVQLTIPSAIYWYTGRDTVAIAPDTLTPLWTVEGTLGPGTIYAGKVLIPVRGGISVHDPATGARARVIPVDRGTYQGNVALDAVGGVILAQRGNTLVAMSGR